MIAKCQAALITIDCGWSREVTRNSPEDAPRIKAEIGFYVKLIGSKLQTPTEWKRAESWYGYGN